MKYAYWSLAIVAFSVAGCTGPVIMGGDAAAIVVTKHWGDPPADTKSQIPPHEEWCYSTMGDSECFAHAQDVQPSRLINVEPQSRYPLDAEAYRKLVVAEKEPLSTDVPTSLTPAPTVRVEQSNEVSITKTTISSPASNNFSKLPQ